MDVGDAFFVHAYDDLDWYGGLVCAIQNRLYWRYLRQGALLKVHQEKGNPRNRDYQRDRYGVG